MNPIEAAYWKGARDAATVIYSELSCTPGVRWRAKKRARDLLIAMNRLGGQELAEMLVADGRLRHRR